VGGQPGLLRFHAKYVSAGEAADYYQFSFDAQDPGEDSTEPRGPDGPYLIIQRQFETPDGGQCYVETRDHRCDRDNRSGGAIIPTLS
jgi:hypothetical protein